MSWISDSSLNWLQKIALCIIKVGVVPKHVAFIMDGNRRFANKANVEKAEGHSKGFDKLSETLKWCLDLGIMQVTVYAFSIENFNRPDDEVSALMDLAKQKFRKLLEEEDVLRREGVNIKIIGDLSRLPIDLHQLIAKAVSITKGNNRARLTIAFSYTARDEITQAVRCVATGVKDKILDVSDVDASLLDRCMYTEDSPPPDLLIRTSGEIRFSDFLLWQSTCASVYFSAVLWPEFTFWEFLKAIFHFQRSQAVLSRVRVAECQAAGGKRSERVDKFLTDLYEERHSKLKMVACGL